MCIIPYNKLESYSIRTRVPTMQKSPTLVLYCMYYRKIALQLLFRGVFSLGRVSLLVLDQIDGQKGKKKLLLTFQAHHQSKAGELFCCSMRP